MKKRTAKDRTKIEKQKKFPGRKSRHVSLFGPVQNFETRVLCDDLGPLRWPEGGGIMAKGTYGNERRQRRGDDDVFWGWQKL